MFKNINLNKLISIGLLSFFAFIIMSSGVAYAASCVSPGVPAGCTGGNDGTVSTGGGIGGITPIQGYDSATLSTDIIGVVNYIIGIVAIIAVVMIVWAGYLYITAGMDEKNVEKAKKMLLYGVIGVVVVVLSYSIVSFAGSFLSL